MISNNEFLVLELLIIKNCYAMELVNKSGHKLKRSSIYNTIKSLIKKKLIKFHHKEKLKTAIGQHKKYYQITEKGCMAWVLISKLKDLLNDNYSI